MTLLGIAVKGRPEQGVYDNTSRYGPLRGDTGCGLEGTDQREKWPGLTGQVT